MGHAAIGYFEGGGGSAEDFVKTVNTARNQAVHVAEVARNAVSSPAGAAAAVRGVADNIVVGAADIVQKAGPVVVTAVDGACKAVGTTPQELGKTVVKTVVSSGIFGKKA